MSRFLLLLSLGWLPAASADEPPAWQQLDPLASVHASRLKGLAFSPDGHHLATVGGAQEVTLHQAAGNRHPEILEGHTGEVRCAAWSPDGQTLASAGGVWNERGTIVLWDLKTRKPRKVLSAGRGQVLSLAFAPDAETIALGCGYKDGDVAAGDLLLCNITSGEVSAFTGQIGPILSLAFSPDGDSLLTAGYEMQDGQELYAVTLWDVPDRKLRRTLATGRTYFEGWQCVAWSADGRFIAAGGRNATDGRVVVWTSSGAPWAQLPNHSGPIWSLAFSPDGDTLAVGDAGAEAVRLWDVQTGREQRQLKAFRGAIFGLAFSPDGQLLAAGGSDGQNGILRRWSRSAAVVAP